MDPDDDPTRPFTEETPSEPPETVEVGPEPEDRTDHPPEAPTADHGSYPQNESTVEAALMPLAEAPVTYQTLRAISKTEFVPASLRGKPEAVFACVLYGRELGLGPMEALSQVDVIDGRPSPSAELLARLIRAAGHSIEVLEASDTACRLRGTRTDNGETLEVAFTIEDAAKVTTRERGQQILLSDTKRWREWPGDMCWARAVGRLHRRLFPDVRRFTSSASAPPSVESEPVIEEAP